MILFILYLVYGAAFIYHLNMKNMFDDDMTEFDLPTIFATIVMVATWPFWVFLVINEAADLKADNKFVREAMVRDLRG